MSTRANIVIKDKTDKLYFYRHSDGYPEGTLPTLKLFGKWVREGKILDNVQQSAGWLVLIGANEYKTTKPEAWQQVYPAKMDDFKKRYFTDYTVKIEPEGWKAGAYEPTTGFHGDIEFMYEIDLEAQEIRVNKAGWKDGVIQFTVIDVVKF